MGDILSFRRCVGESPPVYGARKAFCSVHADFDGPCYLHYEIHSSAFVVRFENYGQALTAATMAIFAQETNFQRVLITANPGRVRSKAYSNAQSWWLENS